MTFVLLLTILFASDAADAQIRPPLVIPQTSSTRQELIELNQELIDALARGDKSVANRIYADDFIRITTQGVVLTKAQVLNGLNGAKGGAKITYESRDIQVFDYGNTAVLVYLSIKHTDDSGQKSDFQYRVADTFVKRNGRWQKAISTGTPIQEPNAAKP